MALKWVTMNVTVHVLLEMTGYQIFIITHITCPASLIKISKLTDHHFILSDCDQTPPKWAIFQVILHIQHNGPREVVVLPWHIVDRQTQWPLLSLTWPRPCSTKPKNHAMLVTRWDGNLKVSHFNQKHVDNKFGKQAKAELCQAQFRLGLAKVGLRLCQLY